MRRLLLIAALVLPAPALAAQGSTDAFITTARAHIAARQFAEADTALDRALVASAYLMDTVHVFVWRAILAHMRGSDSLARVNFHAALALYSALRVNGLDQVAPGLSDVFESEARRFRVYPDSELDERAAWLSGPKLAYPPELVRRRVAGHALVRAVIDTLGEAEGFGLIVLESPDPAFDEPLQQMMLAAQFTPARRKGQAVRSQVSMGFDLHPPALESPTRLITAARVQLGVHHPDSALALTDAALDSANQATAGQRVYALFVQGMAWKIKGRDSLAALSIDAGMTGYRELTARGVDLAPFLKRLADSLRLSRRNAQPAETPFAAPTVVGTVDEPPALVTHPAIRYAPEMQALRIGGTVIVEATLDTTGRVVPATVKVVQTPNPVFDAESKRVVQAAVYRPARIHGRAARVTIRQPITFAAY
jgi:TonB family protein